MNLDKPQSDPSHDSLRRGYERDHMQLRGLIAAVVAIGLVALAIHVGLWHFLRVLDKQVRPADLVRSVVSANRDAPTPAPSLQPTQTHDQTPRQDLRAMLDREDAIFEHLGWKVDRATHRVWPAERIAQVVEQRDNRQQPTTMPGDTR